MVKEGHQDLTDRLNDKWFRQALATLKRRENYTRLTVRERVFVGDMEAGYDLFKQEFQATCKQYNWLKQLAAEVVQR